MKRIFILGVLLLFAAPAYAEHGEIRCISTTPTIDTAAYATGENIGGKLTFTNVLSSSSGSGIVLSVLVSDKKAVAEDMDLVIFRSNPTGTTFTDQAALDVDDADLSKILGIVSFGSTSRFAFADNGVKFVTNIAIPVIGGTSSALSSNLYGALVSRGAPDFDAASDLTVTLCVDQY